MMVLRHLIAANLHHCTQLSMLYLSENIIYEDGSLELAANLHHSTQLSSLGFAIGDSGAKALAASYN